MVGTLSYYGCQLSRGTPLPPTYAIRTRAYTSGVIRRIEPDESQCGTRRGEVLNPFISQTSCSPTPVGCQNSAVEPEQRFQAATRTSDPGMDAPAASDITGLDHCLAATE